MGWLSPRFLPGASTCRSFLWLPRNIVLLATMNAAGPGPAVTLTSSTNLAFCFDIQVAITGTGILGAATGTYSINGATPVAFTLQATVAITGTPLTLNFAAGTYTAVTDAYRSVIDTITDDRSNTWVATSATASVHPFIGSINNKPTIRTDGVARFLGTSTGTLPNALVNGVRTPFTICGAFRYNGSLTPGVNQAVMALCNGSSGQAVVQFSVAATTGVWRVSKRGDTGGTTAVDSAVQATNNAVTFALVQTGTNCTLEIAGTAVINNAAQNVAATVTANIFEIGACHTIGAPSEFFADVDWMGHAAYAGVLSANDRARERQFWKNLYDLAA